MKVHGSGIKAFLRVQGLGIKAALRVQGLGCCLRTLAALRSYNSGLAVSGRRRYFLARNRGWGLQIRACGSWETVAVRIRCSCDRG